MARQRSSSVGGERSHLSNRLDGTTAPNRAVGRDTPQFIRLLAARAARGFTRWIRTLTIPIYAAAISAFLARDMNPYAKLQTFDKKTGALNAIIDTPKKSRNKYSYREARGLYELSGVLPAGAIFPYDFGFLPGTLGGDGDPIDVLILMDEPAFVGCLVQARLLGVIEAEQTEQGKTVRNDRLLAVATKSKIHEKFQSLDDVSEQLLDEIEHFFLSYNDAKGKKFKPLGRYGPERAQKLVKQSIKKARKRRA